jgi:hypothetical protein
MYFERLQQKEEDRGRIFKNFNLFIYGALITTPSQIRNLIGRKVDSIELFPASEGFCLSRLIKGKGMLLLLNAGIFYEFVKSDEFFSDKPRRAIGKWN